MGIQGQCDERVGGQDSELYDSQQGKAFSRIEWMASVGRHFFGIAGVGKREMKGWGILACLAFFSCASGIPCPYDLATGD